MIRILIVGAGDVAQRCIPLFNKGCRIYALTRQPESAAKLRAFGITPIVGDLDKPRSLRRIAGIADSILFTAPPLETDAILNGDSRSKHLIAALRRPRKGAHKKPDKPNLNLQISQKRGRRKPAQSLTRRFCYISTSGVYGDCGGKLITESQPANPQSLRAKRRVQAEQCLRRAAIRSATRLSILRAPGIYAAERLSLARLQRGDPVLHAAEDVFTNHIHADDLARACVLALFRGKGGRAFNICDDSQLAMGDYFDAMADTFALPRPPRATRAECAIALSPMMMSFMRESRRLDNGRAKCELRLRLEHPQTVAALRRIHAAMSAGICASAD